MIQHFPNGMTVADLKRVIKDWPEENEHGEACEVWLCDGSGLSNQATRISSLNAHWAERGDVKCADLLIGYGPEAKS